MPGAFRRDQLLRMVTGNIHRALVPAVWPLHLAWVGGQGEVMLHGSSTIGEWLVETWERSREPGAVPRDAVAEDPRPGALRVAVIDGVTPTDATPPSAGADGAVWAASGMRDALLARRPLEVCASAAHEALRASGATPSPRYRPQVSFAAADLGADGVHLLRAGDCEAWREGPDGWLRLFPQQIDTPEERARMLRWAREHPDRAFLEYGRTRPEHGGIWGTCALGRLPHPSLQSRHLSECWQLVLATDGARRQSVSLLALEVWLGQMNAHQREYPVSRWETGPDDLAVVRIGSAR